MPANPRYCAELVQCFEQYPNWHLISPETKKLLIEHLAATARDDHEAHAAIDSILKDAARASAAQTNRVPTMGEITQWIMAQRDDQYDTPPPASSRGGCGRVFEGSFYESLEGRKQSQCENGWVHKTVWRQIGKLVNEDGTPMRQPYTFSGRCKCQDGGWI